MDIYIEEKKLVVDSFVYLAGINVLVSALETTEEIWDRIIDVNLKGFFFVSKVIAKNMILNGGGSILGIASQHAVVANVDRAAYCASKGKCLLDYEYYLKIENKNDLEKFSVDLDFYKQTGKVDTISKRLVDECRWTNQCSLKRLTRYRVTEDGIKPCITSEKSLLESQEDHMMQLLEANKLCDKAMIQRNCMECAVKDVCSKCACLPNEISREEFCDFMHLYPFVGEYLRKKRIVNFLSKFSKIFEGNAYIEVSSSVHSFEYPIRKTKECAGREVFVFKKNANYYALHIQKGSLIRLEKKYVFLLEAWALERSAEEIVEKMAEKYNMDISSAKMVIEEGYYQLQKGGLI